MATAVSTPAPSLKSSPFYRGFTLGIAGFVLSFNASLVGLVLSIVAYRQSAAAGYKNGLALAGIIISSIVTVIGIVVYMLLAALAASGVLMQMPTAP